MPKKPIFNNWNSTLTSLLWFGLLVLAALAIVIMLSRGASIETNVLSLLPSQGADKLLSRVTANFDEQVSRKHMLVFGGETAESVRSMADGASRRIASSGLFSDVRYVINEDSMKSAIQLYAKYQHHLISQSMRQRIAEGGAEAVVAEAKRKLFSPVSTVNSSILETDPYLMFFDFLMSFSAGRGNIVVDDGRLVVQRDGRYHIVMMLDLSESPYSLQTQDAVVGLVADLKLEAETHDIELMSVGAVNYAKAGVDSARSEVAKIGTLSLLGVLVLLIAAFRSLRPILLSFVAILAGFIGAFAACLSIFGSVHLLTLVFGASLIGISVDYAFHYFADRQMAGAQWRPKEGLAKIFSGVSLGLLSSVIGFMGLCFAPFPAMQQMAVFSVVGLMFAYLTVFLLFPRVTISPAGSSHDIEGALDAIMPVWQSVFQSLRHRYRLFVVIIFIVLGILQLKANDDVKALQAMPSDLVEEENRVKSLLGVDLSTGYFVVRSSTIEATLQEEERLVEKLSDLQSNNIIQGYDAVSRFVPSIAMQREALSTFSRLSENGERVLTAYIESIGLSRTDLNPAGNFLLDDVAEFLTIDQWLSSDVSKPYRQLWVSSFDNNESADRAGKGSNSFMSIVTISGVSDRAELDALADTMEGVYWVDRAAEISSLFAGYRKQASMLVGMAYVAIFLVLGVRYGAMSAMRVLTPPVAATLILLSTLGWFAIEVNLFHVLALFLVLGIGIDYTLFLRETRGSVKPVLLAILLSSGTSLLAFGALAFSEVTAISSFGLTILIGILAALVLAPIALSGSGSEMVSGKDKVIV